MLVLTLYAAQFILCFTVIFHFVLLFHLLAFSPSLSPRTKIPWHPVTFTGALAASLPGAVLRLAVFLQHALMFPPQLVIAPHPLAILLHVRQVRWPNQLHDIFEPCTRLADLA